MTYEVKCTSNGPILLSTQRGANPCDPLVQELAKYTRIAGNKKTPEDHAKIADIQFRLSLPWYDGIGVHIPTVNLWNAIQDAARSEKKGKVVDVYVRPVHPVAKLIYPGPQDIEGLLADPKFRDTRLVNHGTKGAISMVLQTRPMFNQWSFTTGFTIDVQRLDPEDFKKWVVEVGEYHGLGAFRKFFGRFTAEVKEVNK